MIMKQHTFLLIILAVVTGIMTSHAQPLTNKNSTPEDRAIRLNGDTVSLRFTVYKYFPFLDATINGVKGKLLFDTGAGKAFEFDDRLVPVENGKVTGGGFVGSGQKFEVSQYDTIRYLSLDNGRLSFVNAGPIGGHDFSYMNTITSDILGLVGYDFFKGYLFKLDYSTGMITFYKHTTERLQNKDFLKNEKVIAILDFETRKLPNHPVIRMISQKDTLAITFDTGQLGSLALTDELKKKWTNKGSIISQGVDEDGDELVEVRSFELPGLVDPVTFKTFLNSAELDSPVNKAIGISEPNTLTFGYSFLTQYKTVWDYENRKIYLLEQ